MTFAEQNYANFNRELLAVFLSLETFHHFAYVITHMIPDMITCDN